mgnify:FL=1
MLNLKPKKYLIIDPKQVLAGDITTHNIQPGDLILSKINSGIGIVLAQSVNIVKYVKILVNDHEYELVFNSQPTEDEQIELLNCLDKACRNQGLIEFPKVAAMIVRDNIAFKNIDIKNPTIIRIDHLLKQHKYE